VLEQVRRDSALLRELGLHLTLTAETHAHADHVTGAWLLKQEWSSRISISAAAGAQGMDVPVSHGDRLLFGQRYLEVRATPGHTDGCVTYVLDDQSAAFTGDALLIRGCGRTDFQQGSPARLYQSIHEQIFTLPEHCLLYPGHDYRGLTVTSVMEERRYNPRLGGQASESDFAGYMNNLGLPHPKLIDIAVPANLRCGQGAGVAAAPQLDDWGPVRYTFAGIAEMEPLALAEHLAEFQLLDVREANEFDDDLGHLRGARLVPLSELGLALESLDAGRPIITICRSGTRSAQASLMLSKAGFKKVANLNGGLLRWRSEGLPVA
jgi:glyoxylase-like metal-dependent hydrolase (beta-lactamase superfamily II)/rhodanese-related sulfurtransferase